MGTFSIGVLYSLWDGSNHTYIYAKMGESTSSHTVIPSDKRLQPHQSNEQRMKGPLVFIYKTNGDYYYNVPVTMNEERTQITSYPAPVDLSYGGGLRLPTRLVDGYLLDNKGIGPNVAFLSYTYEEYSKMKTAPSMEELMSHIIAKHPLTVWHQCGYRSDYTNLVPQLNQLIEKEYLQK